MVEPPFAEFVLVCMRPQHFDVVSYAYKLMLTEIFPLVWFEVFSSEEKVCGVSVCVCVCRR